MVAIGCDYKIVHDPTGASCPAVRTAKKKPRSMGEKDRGNVMPSFVIAGREARSGRTAGPRSELRVS